jgi:hypothetical protein
MRSRIFVAAFLVVGVLAGGAVTTSAYRKSSPPRWAVVNLSEPTLIGSTIVQGPVLFTHDDSRMTRGEPCTTVQLFDPTTGPLEQIAAFHCIPTYRGTAGTFTVRTRPNEAWRYGCVLTEFQFAGDAEGHGVPAPADVPVADIR